MNDRGYGAHCRGRDDDGDDLSPLFSSLTLRRTRSYSKYLKNSTLMILNLKLVSCPNGQGHVDVGGHVDGDGGFLPHYLAQSQNSFHGDDGDGDGFHPSMHRENARLSDYATLRSMAAENV